MRTTWLERCDRSGWDIGYTVVGGRLPDDPVNGVPERLGEVVTRALSQVMVAATAQISEPSPEVSFWASVVRKVVQRGTRPAIHHGDMAPLSAGDLTEEQLLAAIAGRVTDWRLDESIQLHPTYERPFWNLLSEEATHLRRWCTPQAWLEGLAGEPDADSRRWVDFLIYVPWLPAFSIIEVDGSGHARRPGADTERDRALQQSGARVDRISGAEAIDSHSVVAKRLAGRRPPWLGTAEPSILAAIHGPAAIHRFAYSLAEAVERGHLPLGQTWVIELTDDTGVADRYTNVALDLVASLADVWELEVVPETVVVNSDLWTRGSDGRYQRTARRDMSREPQMRIDVQAFTPAHAELPEWTIPSIVIRSCLLPADLSWTAPSCTDRYNRTGTERSLAALDRLLTDLYGYAEFREAQRDAISRVLSGGDACVLLPTGAGKSLIYQLAGLLRPGVTLTIAPLRSLIDDQERRLRELGIDRVFGLHTGRGLSMTERKLIQRAIGQGEAAFVLVAPERLQIEGFRNEIREAALHHLVNLAVVDEAHCVSEWGHQFRTSYLKLGRNLRRLCRDGAGNPPPVLALTATASPRVLNDMMAELGLDADEPGVMWRPSTFDRKNLHYRAFHTTVGDRRIVAASALDWIASQLGVSPSELAQRDGTRTMSGIVFVPHSKSGLDLGLDSYAEVVGTKLGIEDEQLIARYAGKPPREGLGGWEESKARQADEFRSNLRPVMVSTNAFGMGIDKPNIRYTLHATLPSSIEGFAQESGRAGRDGKDSYCALVAPIDTEAASELIDGRGNRAEYPYAKDDVEIQLGFLKQGFPDPDQEVEIAEAIVGELLDAAGPGGTVTIPRSQRRVQGRRGGHEHSNEKALFRLLLIGVVDDYTIDYGSDEFSVHLASFNEVAIRETTKNFLKRSTAGNRAVQARVDAVPSGELREVIPSLLRVLIDAVFETIEPARALALREMVMLSALGSDGMAIRNRINAYLSEGPVASLLDKHVRNEAQLIPTIEALADVTPDEYEWAGASTRYLESYPDHPLLLAVRALGEAWKRDGSREEFVRIVADYATALRSFSLVDNERVQLTLWTLDVLRGYFEGSRWAWAPDIWEALEESGLPESDLYEAENAVLDLAAEGRFHPNELEYVLVRRARRARDIGATIAGYHRGAA